MSTDRSLKVPARKFHKTFDLDGVPFCLKWSIDDVADWVDLELKLPQYKECFRTNYVTGKKLIHMNASNLPKIGITNFEDIKFITSKVRELLGIADPDWNRSITLPPMDTVAHFIERKSISGKESGALKFDEHVRYLEEFERHGVPKNQIHWSS